MIAVATDRLYRGERTKDHTYVTVHRAPGESQPLGSDAAPEFDWGRPEDGARALAAALVEDAFGDEGTPDMCERVFHEIVLKLPFIDPWLLWHRDLLEWAEEPKASG